MSTVTLDASRPSAVAQVVQGQNVAIYGHSALVYWWPVIVAGYVISAMTYLYGETVQVGNMQTLMLTSKNPGVIYCVVLLVIVLLTNVTLRGMSSVAVITGILGLTFMFAYLGWWDDIFEVFDRLVVFMNFGFYFATSTGLLLIWVLSVFVLDRLDYWEFRPGQMIHHTFMGGGERTHDTHGMSVNKLRDDLFRHWVLGLGSGDVRIATSGGDRNEIIIPNVMFLESKLHHIQQLVAMKPDEQKEIVTVVAGDVG
jgi:hypothetical protein